MNSISPVRPLSSLPAGTAGTVPPPVDPTVTALLATLELAVQRLQSASWTGHELASLQWCDRLNRDHKGRLDVALVEVRPLANQDGATLTLRCKPSAATAVDIHFRLQWSPEATEVRIRLQHEKSWRYWVCARSENGEWEADTELVTPRSIPALEQLGDVWFPREPRKVPSRALIVPRVERLSESSVKKEIGPYMPRYEAKWSLEKAPGLGRLSEATPDEWAAAISAFVLWSLLVQSVARPNSPGEVDGLVTTEARGLPSADFYVLRRAVDLKPMAVQRALVDEKLEIPWQVVEAACAALNSGKHVIFTGPPGCGKSKLAIILAKLATGRDGMLVTASSAWTSGDLVGRYFPATNGQGLIFRPGFFLQAVSDRNRWLIIDEFNRANIDECFGELFSVLAGDAVDLAFDEKIDDAESEYGRVRIVPDRAYRKVAEAAAVDSVRTSDYPVGPSFRLIGTMNDADRATLHQLSFALLRRFQVIRVEAPSTQVVRELIDQKMSDVTARLMLGQLGYKIVRRRAEKRSHIHALQVDDVKDAMHKLFANVLPPRRRGDSEKHGYTDLVRERVVGLATVHDIIRFVAEAMRASGEGVEVIVLDPQDAEVPAASQSAHDHATALAMSFLAIAVALSVFPQLDALAKAERDAAIRHILGVFGPENCFMRRIEEERAAPGGGERPDGEGGATQDFKNGQGKPAPVETVRLVLRFVEHTNPADHNFEFHHHRFVSLQEFLVGELRQQYRGETFHSLLKGGGQDEGPADDV